MHLSYHNDRVNNSRKALFNADDFWDLSRIITLPELDPNVIYSCRIKYSSDIDKIEFNPYQPRKIQKLNLVCSDQLDYSFKYADRSSLEKLKQEYSKTPDSDILIIRKGLITDTSFSNIVFYDGCKWVTPASPLLQGTKRAYYLDNKMIETCSIAVNDLHKYQYARLINAMLDLEDERNIHRADIV